MGHRWATIWIHVDVDDDGKPAGPMASRDFAWNGGDRLEVDAPADVEYTQGPVTKLTVTGPKEVLDRMTVQDGRIDLDGRRCSMSGSLKVVMTAPNITNFEANGSQSISINDYKQDQLQGASSTAPAM